MAQHISIRIPWKDNDYSGNICNEPSRNNSCLRLKGIAEKRNDELESNRAGQPISECAQDIPCLTEGGCFMSPNEFYTTVIHPYQSHSQPHKHFRETEQIYPSFSCPAHPFLWVRKEDDIPVKVKRYGIDYDAISETELETKMGFKISWVQTAKNQRVIFDYFFHNVKPKESLAVLYVKMFRSPKITGVS